MRSIALTPERLIFATRDEQGAFHLQRDPYFAFENTPGYMLLFYNNSYLCEWPRHFEKVKGLSRECIGVYECADTEADAKARAIRRLFDKTDYEYVAAIFFRNFPEYADGRRIDGRLLRFPRLPVPRNDTPIRHCCDIIAPAIERLPAKCQMAMATVAYSYFYGFAWWEPLPNPPNWVIDALRVAQPDQREDGEGNGARLVVPVATA